MISLARNESAFGPSPKAIRAGKAALVGSALNPDPDWHDLRQAISRVYDLGSERLLRGVGSVELIGALIRAFSGPGDRGLGPAHGDLFVVTACQQAGAAYATVPGGLFHGL